MPQMSSSSEAPVPSWSTWPTALEQVCQRFPDLGQRAAKLAALLAALVPKAILTGCRLDLEKGSFLGLHAPADRLAADEQESWRSWLAAMTGPADAPGRATLVLAEIRGATSSSGYLLVVLTGRVPAARSVRLQELLVLAAHTLGLRLDVEAVSEAAGDLTHALNNSLNSMVLQAAVLQTRVPEPLRGDLSLIRQEGARAAALLQPLGRLRLPYRTTTPS